jgi:hypothetical protein
VAAALANLDTPDFRAWLRTAHCHPGRDRTVYPNSQLADIVRKPRIASTTQRGRVNVVAVARNRRLFPLFAVAVLASSWLQISLLL